METTKDYREIIDRYNAEYDGAFGKAFRGEIGINEYREETKRIDREFSELIIQR